MKRRSVEGLFQHPHLFMTSIRLFCNDRCAPVVPVGQAPPTPEWEGVRLRVIESRPSVRLSNCQTSIVIDFLRCARAFGLMAHKGVHVECHTGGYRSAQTVTPCRGDEG